MSFRVTVHAYPSCDGHSKRSEAVQLDIPCGTGEQLVRWLGHAACLKLAYCKRDLMHRYLPHAVLGKDGNILDADHVMKEVKINAPCQHAIGPEQGAELAYGVNTGLTWKGKFS